MNQPPRTPGQPVLSINAVKAALATGDLVGAQFTVAQPDKLANLIAQFRADGYRLSDPIQETRAQFQVAGHTTWLLQVEAATFACELHFFVPDALQSKAQDELPDAGAPHE